MGKHQLKVPLDAVDTVSFAGQRGREGWRMGLDGQSDEMRYYCVFINLALFYFQRNIFVIDLLIRENLYEKKTGEKEQNYHNPNMQQKTPNVLRYLCRYFLYTNTYNRIVYKRHILHVYV